MLFPLFEAVGFAEEAVFALGMYTGVSLAEVVLWNLVLLFLCVAKSLFLQRTHLTLTPYY